MKRLVTIALCGLSACGSLDNEPLKTGVVRGQLVGSDPGALVTVVGREDLVARPDATGHFELRSVPVGPNDVFIIVNALKSRRLTVNVGAASIADLGTVEARVSAKLEVYVNSIGGHRLTGGTAYLVGTPLSSSLRPPENEAEFLVPAGCYEVRVVVPGLGEHRVSAGCVSEGAVVENRLEMEPPDGSPGREGCQVTGCDDGLVCQADLSCR